MARSIFNRAMLGAAALVASVAAQSTCETVEKTTAIAVLKPASVEYTTEQTHYWSTFSGDLKPTCILEPESPEEVAAILSILRQNNETFAVKSGGHNPNNYFASVDGGPLISTKRLNEIIFDAATETARVGPGNRWDEVGEHLDATGYTAVGGRIGNVGVGGYLLGNGLSFMSTEYGWAANSVLEYTVVLANSSIVTVSNTSHPDLYMVLKGGGNNFGIVTSYLLRVYAQGDVWGGNLEFDATPENNAALLTALRNFTENYPDEKAGIIMTAERTLATLLDIWVIFLYYNGPEPPQGVFDSFLAIGPTVNNCKTRRYSELLSNNNWAVVKGSVYTIGTETMPLPSKEDGPEVMQNIFDHWVNVSNTAQEVSGLIASIAFQPMPKRIASLAKSKGGDLLDLDDSIDRIVVELDYSFLFKTDYDKIDITMSATYDGIQSLVKGYQESSTLPSDVYLPLFMNDCFYPQDYFGRLRPEKLQLAQKVQAEVDPNGFFKERTGGFKIPAA
ncbi:FAD binding domain-containing protein [Hypoxylon trugodes]|uniref:FAD binding domain-containing protein n=1 Tax=Hypoxylon trugodes TaxID=326681 RepID=UPI00219A181A|nr:FAD binding domain-containing protein [Hypoxylon trugodes]KAI1394288.1 FAD binding domain-containing protein [Hypoxylon trugodes]